MLIDLKSIDPKDVARRQERDRIRAKLNKMTVRQLRQFARDNHISLGGASSKQVLIIEIMGQYGHQWGPKNG